MLGAEIQYVRIISIRKSPHNQLRAYSAVASCLLLPLPNKEVVSSASVCLSAGLVEKL